ncbi:hypothetical protein JMJ56_26700 [Belnapia sp. T18]|uniref:Uncharacterized protein n=1 Tax=Belnapia arida TaxID=2804533 RepID=A0ABS1UAL6_9PROT|nr:hypothetical protein [Belnapia arida]MBL6081585.1 hypothetical protein [Belnapia arida]
MKDAASAAAMSDPWQNPSFRRRWQEPLDHCMPQSTPTPELNVALEITGRALREQWRRERAKREGVPS